MFTVTGLRTHLQATTSTLLKFLMHLHWSKIHRQHPSRTLQLYGLKDQGEFVDIGCHGRNPHNRCVPRVVALKAMARASEACTKSKERVNAGIKWGSLN